MAYQLFIVEDHPVMRQGYAAIGNQEIDLEICGETGSVPEARARIPELEPDLVIVDLSLEEGSGLELIKDLLSVLPDLAILVVSVHDEALYAERSLQAGAAGYLTKSESSGKLVEAIREILDGGVYYGEQVKEKMLLRYLGGNHGGTGESALQDLSDRELEVFEYMGRGLTTREIAEKLNLSPKTIDTYRARTRKKLAVDSNAELRRQAVVWVELKRP